MRKMLFVVGGCFTPLLANAGGIPVLDSIPRWDEGVGVELYHESYGSDHLLRGSDKIANPLGLESRTEEWWLSGTYYPVKERGVFVKLPYRELQENGTHKSGLGDAEVGLVLRRFWNFAGSTADITLAPQLRLPTGSDSGAIPLGDGSVDTGMILSAKWEDFTYMLMGGVEYWHNTEGNRGIDAGDEVTAHLMAARHFYLWPEEQFGVFLMPTIEYMWEGDGRDISGPSGRTLVHGGPAAKFYKANYLLYLGADFPIYERVNGTQLSEGTHYHFSVGTAF